MLLFSVALFSFVALWFATLVLTQGYGNTHWTILFKTDHAAITGSFREFIHGGLCTSEPSIRS
jgi:hypothetical protein